jgi:hypothetical protein
MEAVKAAPLTTGTGLAKARLTSRRWPESLCVLLYAVLVSATIAHHEPWADEAQAWQIAHSLPIGAMFRQYLRYEGSPGLWHLLLALLGRMHVSYAGMHWICGAAAVAGTALLVFLAPFPRYIRFLLPFSYYLAFQYAVIARSYVLVPPMLFLIAALWRRSGPVTLALLLGLLGNLAMHALAISAGLAVVYAVEVWQGTRRVERRALLGGAVLLLALWGAAVLTVAPSPPDLSFRGPVNNAPLLRKLLEWPRRSIRTMLLVAGLPRIVGGVIWLVIAWRFLETRRLVYLLPVVSLSLLLGYYYSFWHVGLFLPTLAVGWWIAGMDTKPSWAEKAAVAGVLCVLTLQIAWTAYAVNFDLRKAYSPDPAAARFLAPHVAAGEAIALTYVRAEEFNAYGSVGLGPYFGDRSIFMNQPDAFWWWTTREHTDAELERALDARPPLVVAEYQGPPPFVPERDVSGERVEELNRRGYRLTHTFCGEKVQQFQVDDVWCHLIFER